MSHPFSLLLFNVGISKYPKRSLGENGGRAWAPTSKWVYVLWVSISRFKVGSSDLSRSCSSLPSTKREDAGRLGMGPNEGGVRATEIYFPHRQLDRRRKGKELGTREKGTDFVFPPERKLRILFSSSSPHFPAINGEVSPRTGSFETGAERAKGEEKKVGGNRTGPS